MIRDFYATTEQIAERFGVSPKTVKRWVKSKKLPAFQESQNAPYMAYEEDIVKWLPKFKQLLTKSNK